MNRSYLIIMLPVLLAAAGYIVVLRSMGFAPGYARLIAAVGLLCGAIWWVGRRTASKAERSRQSMRGENSAGEKRRSTDIARKAS